jgi:hypothetical protein
MVTQQKLFGSLLNVTVHKALVVYYSQNNRPPDLQASTSHPHFLKHLEGQCSLVNKEEHP